MTDYYKATRPDGTSFYDGQTQWDVGKTVRIAKPYQAIRLCGGGILHFSDTPAETLIGGSWPCRLFRVKPDKIIASEGHKHGAWSVKVLEELPAWQALGPNGQQVAALIERAGRLTFEEAKALAVARDAAWDVARVAAWDAARDAAWDAARDAARVAAWNAARVAAWAVARDDAAWDAAWDAAVDAAGALVVKDLITPEQFAILYGPWQKVIGS